MTTPDDPFSFFQKMWSNHNLPLNVEQMDKKIQDLRMVENWLQLNLQMVQTTIASFETQKNFMQSAQGMFNTIATPPNTQATPLPQLWQQMQEQFMQQSNQWLKAHQEKENTANTEKTAKPSSKT